MCPVIFCAHRETGVKGRIALPRRCLWVGYTFIHLFPAVKSWNVLYSARLERTFDKRNPPAANLPGFSVNHNLTIFSKMFHWQLTIHSSQLINQSTDSNNLLPMQTNTFVLLFKFLQTTSTYEFGSTTPAIKGFLALCLLFL